jgi:hypothetical protein
MAKSFTFKFAKSSFSGEITVYFTFNDMSGSFISGFVSVSFTSGIGVMGFSLFSSIKVCCWAF